MAKKAIGMVSRPAAGWQDQHASQASLFMEVD